MQKSTCTALKIFQSVKEGWHNSIYVRTAKLRADETVWSETISQFTQVNKERLAKLAEWVDQNKVNIHIEKTFSLDEAAKALDYLRDIHPRGKIVLAI